jgi:hypothetical protein
MLREGNGVLGGVRRALSASYGRVLGLSGVHHNCAKSTHVSKSDTTRLAHHNTHVARGFGWENSNGGKGQKEPPRRGPITSHALVLKPFPFLCIALEGFAFRRHCGSPDLVPHPQGSNSQSCTIRNTPADCFWSVITGSSPSPRRTISVISFALSSLVKSSTVRPVLQYPPRAQSS